MTSSHSSPNDEFHTPEDGAGHMSPPPTHLGQRCRRQLPLPPDPTSASSFIDSVPLSTSSQDAATQNHSQITNVSVENQVKCEQCSQPRFFKGNRGLKIHTSKVHRSAPPIILDQGETVSVSTFWETLSQYKNNLHVLKRIPRGARLSVASCLVNDIKKAISSDISNSVNAWEHLLTFPYRILHVPKNTSDSTSLTNKIKHNCMQNSKSCPVFSFPSSGPIRRKYSSPYSLVEDKMAEGDIRGSARLLFSTDTLAPDTPETLLALKEKHPPSPGEPTVLDAPDENPLVATPLDVISALSSFPSGSAGGLDALTPQHLKDLTGAGCGEIGDALLKELTALVNLMLSGKVNDNITDILYGANLCALLKKDGGIRPIAVGTVYRRLAAKVCCKNIKESLCKEFQPLQLGFGSRGGCEAAIHALRSYLSHQTGEVLVKIDVRNAFNSVNRTILLNEVHNKIPHIYNFIRQCYGKPSKLVYKNSLISSEVGCQQGDPLGPALFSLAIHPIIKNLGSKFNVWYLDDGTLAGNVTTVYEDLKYITNEFKTIGLSLNFSKCEIFIPSFSTVSKNDTLNLFEQVAPKIKLLDNASLRLLGTPILDESIPDFVEEKINLFRSCSDRLQKINSHVAFYIILYCLFVPKFMYSLRCCQLWNHTLLLQKLDSIQRNTLTTILNIAFDDHTWRQASLPVRFGGLGIRKISSVALPAFLSSAHSTHQLVTDILASSLPNYQFSLIAEALESWQRTCPDGSLPKDPSSQRQWDGPLCSLEFENLLNSSNSPVERARLLAAARWESGLWLHALPSRNIGTLLDNNSFRLAASLRVGTICQVPHRCVCGDMADQLGHHGLSCARSAGRIPRHADLNGIIRRAFVTAGVPSVLEPSGLMRDDGKRPDGMTLIPWKVGRPLVWDATCVDTLAPSHLPGTTVQAGAAAAKAENLKRHKYSRLDRVYMFVPFAVETLGPWGPAALSLYRDLAKRLVEASGVQNAGIYFAQKLSIAIQRGNAASILGTFPSANGLLD